MKTLSPTRFGLGAALLLVALSSSAHAASITVKNLGGYVVWFGIDRWADRKPCDPAVHDETRSLPALQHHTVDLDKQWGIYQSSDLSRCNGASTYIRILNNPFTYDWYFLPYENRYPTGFKLVQKAKVVNGEKTKEAVWLVEGGLPGEANRPLHGDLTLVLRGSTSWATVDYYTITRDFRRMDLSGANLTGANLSETDFRNANLIEANLSKANLKGADLRGADLWKAQFSEAYLLDVKTDHTTRCPNDQRGPCW